MANANATATPKTYPKAKTPTLLRIGFGKENGKPYLQASEEFMQALQASPAISAMAPHGLIVFARHKFVNDVVTEEVIGYDIKPRTQAPVAGNASTYNMQFVQY